MKLGSCIHLEKLRSLHPILSLDLFLTRLSLLRVSFWDTAMSIVRRTCGLSLRTKNLRLTRHPSINILACVHSRGNSFDPEFMKLCQNVDHNNM